MVGGDGCDPDFRSRLLIEFSVPPFQTYTCKVIQHCTVAL